MAAISPGPVSEAESVPDSLASPDRILTKDLAGLDDRELLDIVRLSPRASGPGAAACELLVTRYRGLVWSCVRRYPGSPEPAEDLMQVGYVGLLKAIGNFDPAADCSLATYALPCINGELKRHFRDKRWQVHVRRPVQELVLQVRQATWRLAQELGRTPADTDLARHLGVSGDDLRQARRAELAFQPYSLDAPLAGQPGIINLADYLGQEDPRIEHVIAMQAVATHWGELPPREQKILLMDFRGGMTQVQIGQRLGISQMHVSRLRAHALGYLRSRLLDPQEHPVPDGAPAAAPQPSRTMNLQTRSPAGHPGTRRDSEPDTGMAAGMELRQLRYFVAVAEELHFGRAAEREHVVQSALSQQVQRLERELGVSLLERSTHHVGLTAAGAVFLAEARQILAHADRAAAVARSAAHADAGRAIAGR